MLLLPLHGLLFSGLILLFIHSSHCQSQPCYNGSIPLRCEPLPITFSLRKVPIVNSTCGDPPSPYSLGTYMSTEKEFDFMNLNTCCICNSSDPDNAHYPELMTDFSDGIETWWQSENDVSPVSIEIDLGTEVQVHAILFNFISFKPNGFYIEKSSDNGKTFEPFHYFAHDCLEMYMIDPEKQLTEDTELDLLCQRLFPNPGGVNFVPSLNRPSTNDSVPGFSRDLYDFMTITNIRVILDEHRFKRENITFFALEDLSVVGKCQCNGHASNCSIENNGTTTICGCEHNTAGNNCERCLDQYNDLQWDIATGFEPFECKKCECNGHSDSCEFNETLFLMSNSTSGGMCTECRDNTQGPNCEQCMEHFYPNQSLPISDENYCQACGCNTIGTVDDGVCERFNGSLGQCMCKANVMGRTCDECKNGYFNLAPDNADGCTDCGCNPMLSNITSTCDPITGTCNCLSNVVGNKCQTCSPGFYQSEPQTCSPCNCDSGGALSNVCDVYTGQCDCRDGITGRTCRVVEPNRYFPFIDHVIFEAEESSKGSSFDYSYRLPANSMNNTGSGYITIRNGSNVHLGDFTPPVGGLYKFVLRYQSELTWDQVGLTLWFDSSINDYQPPSYCTEHNDPSHSYYYQNLSVAQVGAVVESVCLRQGRTYSIMINGLHSEATDTIEIDSMVVLFAEPNNLTSLSNSTISTVYSYCLPQFESLLTRNDTILQKCENVSFSVFAEIYNGTLECNCSANGSLNITCTEYGGQCPCKTPLNIGRECGMCAAGSYVDDEDSDGCTDCSCTVNGSVSPFCDQVTGQCICYANVNNRTCDVCVPDTYDLQAGVGCTQCNCHPNGSMLSQCDQDGSCACKPGVIGEKCDICDPQNYNFPLCSECNCDEAGSIDLSCTIAGQCSCRSNTMGLTCNKCVSGSFNLNQSNDEGCQPCYCSGIKDSTCVSANGYTYDTISTNLNQWVIDSEMHLNAPSEFLGNRLTSYRQYLTIVIDGGIDSTGDNDYEVLIEGGKDNSILVANFTRRNNSTGLILEVRFIESIWINAESDVPVTAYQLQDTLMNLTTIRIDMNSIDSNGAMSVVSMDIASTNGNGSAVGWVEQCDCGPSYDGLSCEECADGYYRDSYTGHCIPCQCNDHSDYCDKLTGICVDCSNNTDGGNCEICQEGYYGDPLNNITCLQCECPFTGNKGQYSPTCQLAYNGTNAIANCTSCGEGHIGIDCGSCDSGYYGDPLGKYGNSTKCTNCSCNSNIDPNDADSCNKTNGICLKCLNNSDGDECERCANGFYGDAIVAKNCTDCQCDNWGSIHPQCNSTGDCECKDNITGSKCSECEPLHYNSSVDGCGPCDCDPVGSLHETCNNQTGQCQCKSHVTGRRCDTCEIGYFNLTENGCEDCQCTSGAIDESCNDDGVCNCTAGVTGDKCDICDQNYFLSGSQCTACPSCYNDVQNDYKNTTSYYIRLRVYKNTLNEQNDDMTFGDKFNTSITLVSKLNNTVSVLESEYWDLYIDIQDILTQTNDLYEDAKSLDMLIEIAETKVSPYAKLVESAKLIIYGVKQEIYAGRGILNETESKYYPEIWQCTDYLNTWADESNMTYLALEEYVDELEMQTATIHGLVEQASNATSVSMTTANLMSVVSTNNSDVLSMVQNTVSNLNANLSFVIHELMRQNLSIIHASMNISSINESLPPLPSMDNINWLLHESSRLNDSLRSISDNYSNLLEQYSELNNSFTGIQSDFMDIYMILSAIHHNITSYLNELTDSLNNADMAVSSANGDINRGYDILADLRDFTNATSQLKSQADEALLLTSGINKTLTMIEEIVSNNLVHINDIVSQLQEILEDAITLKEDSDALKKDFSSLSDNSLGLLNASSDLLAIYSNNQNSIDQLYSDIAASNSEISDIDQVLQDTKDVVYSDEIQDLPTEAHQLSSEASTVVSELDIEGNGIFLVEEEFLQEVQAIVSTAASSVDSMTISELYNQLDAMYTAQDSELSMLNKHIADIDQRANRLKQILESLPSNCDN